MKILEAFFPNTAPMLDELRNICGVGVLVSRGASLKESRVAHVCVCRIVLNYISPCAPTTSSHACAQTRTALSVSEFSFQVHPVFQAPCSLFHRLQDLLCDASLCTEKKISQREG